MPNTLDLPMQLFHQPSTPPLNQQAKSPTPASIAAFNLSLPSMTSGTVINSSLISTNGLTVSPGTMTTTSQSNVNSVLNAQLNALGLSGLSNLNELSSLTSLANLENTGDYQNTLLNQLNQNSSLLNRTNGTSLDSLISSADSLSPSANSAQSITTIANLPNLHKSTKNSHSTSAQNKLNQQAMAASNGQASPNLISELLNYDLRKLYENVPLNALYPALFGSSPLLRDQHALAYKQTLQVETPLDLSMSVKDESMDCDPTEDELEEQKMLMNANYESLLNSEQLLNLNAKQVNLLKSLANGQQQLNLMKKENLESNKLTKDDELLLKKSIEQRFSPLSNKELNLQQASQKVILQHLQNKQHLKQNRKSDLSDQPISSAPQSPASVHSLQSVKSDLSTGKPIKGNKPSSSPRLNGGMQEKTTDNHRNETSTIENRSPIASPCSPISSPLLNNVNGLFNHIDSSSLSQHLLNSQLQVPANHHNSSSRTSSPSLNSASLDSELLSKLSAFQQLLNQQQSSPTGQPATAGNMNSLLSNLMSLNRNGTTTPQPITPNSAQLSSMSTLNLLNNLINGNNNLSNLASSQNSNQPPVSSSPSSTAQSRNQLLNTLQKLNSLNNPLNNPNSSNSSFKDSSVNINNSNNSANSVSTVNSSSNGSKFNDSISNGPLSSPNNLNVAWPNSQTPPTSNGLVTLANNINSSLNYAQASGAATGQQITLNGNVKLTLDANCDTLAALQTAAAVVNAKKVMVMDDSMGEKGTIIKKSRVRTMLPCEYCGKAFDRPSLLRRHLRTHTGEKPHCCAVCGKGFSTSSSLNTHKRIHTGEKPHQCSVCHKSFTASSNLYYHRMTHQREKPHKCTFKDCHKSFPTPGDLKSHSYSHNGCWPFQCPVCNRGFSKVNNLKHHMQQHDLGGKVDKHDKHRMITQG